MKKALSNVGPILAKFQEGLDNTNPFLVHVPKHIVTEACRARDLLLKIDGLARAHISGKPMSDTSKAVFETQDDRVALAKEAEQALSDFCKTMKRHDKR